MATSSRHNSFQRTLFLSVGGIFLAFAVCFSLYQYHREKEFKIDIMHSRLQAFNYAMMQTLGREGVTDSMSFVQYVSQHGLEGLRVTVVDTCGRVLRDSSQPLVSSLDNHLDRTEIQAALSGGEGYAIKRTSASTHDTYFYSATLFGDIVLRSAVPYSSELTRSLRADNAYLIFALTLTLLLGLVLYLNTSRIAAHVSYLREFALKAGRGEELDHELEREMPDDELGDVCHTVIVLYWKLRHAEEEKVRLKRQLTQNAAHELKTPAASIHGYLESILEHPDMPEDKRQHFLERCYAQSERMDRLLQDMSTLTRLDERTSMQPCREGVTLVDVVQLIHSMLDDLSLNLEQSGIQPELFLPPAISVRGDRSLLYSIFRNIVDNSLAYAQGATKVSIVCAECEAEVAAQGKGSTVRRYYEFTLSDNGQGVPPQHLPHLFERFYRVDEGRSRKAGGTGLGLAIVKNAVALHGGTVTAESTPGGGLTIRFTLPRAE
ncbi:MAG: ATP-binding protein [Prevotellaceae bacterium]|nr:ATP-binding protein [Prevotellaceae bacterium]